MKCTEQEDRTGSEKLNARDKEQIHGASVHCSLYFGKVLKVSINRKF